MFCVPVGVVVFWALAVYAATAPAVVPEVATRPFTVTAPSTCTYTIPCTIPWNVVSAVAAALVATTNGPTRLAVAAALLNLPVVTVQTLPFTIAADVPFENCNAIAPCGSSSPANLNETC